MRRIVVPLDGTELSEAILPEARRLAGPDGELVLIRNVWITPDHSPLASRATEASSRYLEEVAKALRAEQANSAPSPDVASAYGSRS